MKRVNQPKTESSNTGYGYYQDSVTLLTKGLEYEVVSILSLYTAVDFSSNRFEGHIPGIIGDLIALRVLNLSHNELQAPWMHSDRTPNSSIYLIMMDYVDSLFRKFFTLLYLFTITFASTEEATALLKWKSTFKNHNNSLLASWQPSSDACSDLYGVSCINGRVNRNNLSGTIPPEIGNFTNLIYLDLSINQISGKIPPQIGSLARLHTLYIFDNNLNGSILEEIGYLSSLTGLALSTNSLNGSIPASLGNLKNLNYLELFNNQLSNPIPSELENLKNLTNLGLFNNQLSGPIPSELGNLKNLNDLGLSNNQLSGQIPSVLGESKKSQLSVIIQQSTHWFNSQPQQFDRGNSFIFL
ncbi:putative leucine-rich repeat receptor-like protein kinase [Capsicum chinense]|nr:putative leucine-rich repeat receptor-like protein kinase [Capsicum chinense]